jgi:ABC-2 type transport system permease protein
MILFFYTVYVLNADFKGDLWQIIVFQILIGIMAVCLGTFISVFAKNEFQMIQFIPLIIVPQVFICGLLFPISSSPNGFSGSVKFCRNLCGGRHQRADAERPKPAGGGQRGGDLAAFSVSFMILAALSLRRECRIVPIGTVKCL